MANIQPKKNKWWTYQAERFPLVAYSILVASLVFAPLGHSAATPVNLTTLITFFLTFLNTLFMFALLRIADEFKDYAEDCLHRSYRPVPRGLVSLGELKVLAIILLTLQFVFTTALLALHSSVQALFALGALWSYWALMSKEFFVADWLKTRPIVYLFSHMMLMPLLAFYILAMLNLPVHWAFIWICWLAGLLLEIGRKIKHEHEEEDGVESYSKLWRKSGALSIWLVLAGIWLLSLGLSQAHWLGLVLTAATILITSALFAFKGASGKWLEHASSVTLLIGFLTFGLSGGLNVLA